VHELKYLNVIAENTREHRVKQKCGITILLGPTISGSANLALYHVSSRTLPGLTLPAALFLRKTKRKDKKLKLKLF